MRKGFRVVSIAVSALTLVGAIGLSTATAGDKKAMSALDKGKELAFDKKKGNCLACHLITGGEQAGNIGPPLIAMKARFPDKAVLRSQIADARGKNPNTIMPPFEAHSILSSEEVDKITEFVHTL